MAEQRGIPERLGWDGDRWVPVDEQPTSGESVEEFRARRDQQHAAEAERSAAAVRESREALDEHGRQAVERIDTMFPPVEPTPGEDGEPDFNPPHGDTEHMCSAACGMWSCDDEEPHGPHGGPGGCNGITPVADTAAGTVLGEDAPKLSQRDAYKIEDACHTFLARHFASTTTDPAADEIVEALDPVVASLVAAAEQRADEWKAAYEAKLADFARETERTSRMLAACQRSAPRVVVGEALLGYERAQQDIACAAEAPR